MTSAWLIETPTNGSPLYVGIGGSPCIAPWVFDANMATKFGTQAEAQERLDAFNKFDSKARFTEAVVREHGFED